MSGGRRGVGRAGRLTWAGAYKSTERTKVRSHVGEFLLELTALRAQIGVLGVRDRGAEVILRDQ